MDAGTSGIIVGLSQNDMPPTLPLPYKVELTNSQMHVQSCHPPGGYALPKEMLLR